MLDRTFVKNAVADMIKEGINRVELGKPMMRIMDWSKIGSGFILYHKHCKCKDETLAEKLCCKDGWT